MNLASLFTLSVFFLYTIISWMILGPLDSISETYYKYRAKNFSAAFNIFGLLVLAGCIWQVQYGHKDVTNVLFILSGASVWFLTVASLYKTQDLHHYIPTIASILFGFAAVWSEYGLGFKFYTALGGFVALAVILKVARMAYYTTVVELLALVAILYWFLWN